MKASDIFKDALRFRGTLQKDFALHIGQLPQTLSTKMAKNNFSAQELIDYLEILGYSIKLSDQLKKGELLHIRHRSANPRAIGMVDGITYDTAKSDSLCCTHVSDGRFEELFVDPGQRFFTVTYSSWPGEFPRILSCSAERARSLYELYASCSKSEFDQRFSEQLSPSSDEQH